MKVSEVIKLLDGFETTKCSAKALNAYDDVKIRTLSTTSEVVDKHYNEIKQLLKGKEGDVVYVRRYPSLIERLDEEGEQTGYAMVTRLQFGRPGECITARQYRMLVDAGVINEGWKIED